MNIIKKLYRKLKTSFSKKQLIGPKEKDPSQIAGSMVFHLYKDSTIDIICYTPEIKEIESNELTQSAENFGNFIGAITDGVVSDTIVNLLDKSKKESKDPIDQLFIDNILFFWAMSHMSRKSSKDKKGSSKPVIRPTAVFSQTKPSVD